MLVIAKIKTKEGKRRIVNNSHSSKWYQFQETPLTTQSIPEQTAYKVLYYFCWFNEFSCVIIKKGRHFNGMSWKTKYLIIWLKFFDVIGDIIPFLSIFSCVLLDTCLIKFMNFLWNQVLHPLTLDWNRKMNALWAYACLFGATFIVGIL